MEKLYRDKDVLGQEKPVQPAAKYAKKPYRLFIGIAIIVLLIYIIYRFNS